MWNTNNLIPLFLFFGMLNTAPVEERKLNTSINEIGGESRAGVLDTLNPFNKGTSVESNKSKDNGSNTSPLSGLQNIFNISSNPFEQLFASGSGSNFLNDVKIFLVGTQGMVFPASAILGGFQNFIQTLGNMGDIVQGAQNLLPTLPGS